MANHELVQAARMAKMNQQAAMQEMAIINAGMQSFFAKRVRHDQEMRTRMFATSGSETQKVLRPLSHPGESAAILDAGFGAKS